MKPRNIKNITNRVFFTLVLIAVKLYPELLLGKTEKICNHYQKDNVFLLACGEWHEILE